MSAIRFRATIALRGINPFVPVSAAQAARLRPGWRRPLPVLVRVNGAPREPWRINMMPAGDGSFLLYLHGIVRKASATAVGDRVQVELRLDEAYEEHRLPPLAPGLRSALARSAGARAAWAALTPSRRREILRYLAALKTPEARRRTLARVLAMLEGGPAGAARRSARTRA